MEEEEDKLFKVELLMLLALDLARSVLPRPRLEPLVKKPLPDTPPPVICLLIGDTDPLRSRVLLARRTLKDLAIFKSSAYQRKK